MTQLVELEMLVDLDRMFVDLEKIRAIAERVAKSEGIEWVDVELKGGRSNPLLRIYVDKPDGVSHADCQNVSEQVSVILDVEDPFPGPYVLEVSSPGLDRKLDKPSAFEHFAARRARVALREPLGEEKVCDGRLAGIGAARVRPQMAEGKMQEPELGEVS